jgi:hypothetical protein
MPDNFLGPTDDTWVYSEADVFPTGLPDVSDIKLKKRKTEQDRLLFNEGKGPCNSPINQICENPETTYSLDDDEFRFDIEDTVDLNKVVDEAVDDFM